MDGDTLEQLTPAQQRVLGRFVNVGGEDAVRTFNRLDSDALDDLLAIGVRCTAEATTSTSGASTLAGGRACPSDEVIDQWYDDLSEADVGEAEVRRHVDRVTDFEGEAQEEAMELVADAGDDGIEAVDRLVDADGSHDRPSGKSDHEARPRDLFRPAETARP